MNVFIYRNGKTVELTGDELASHQAQIAIDVAANAERVAAENASKAAREAALVARKAKREQILKRTNAQSLPELRAKLNELIEFLGGES